MGFMKNLFGKAPSTKPTESTLLKDAIFCSKCGQRLKLMGNHGGGDPAFDYWHGNVCLSCRRVFCPKCISTNGPTPCPNCGSPTKPAHRLHLQVIYGSSELIEMYRPHMPSVNSMPDIDNFITKTREALEAKNLKEFAQQTGLASFIAEESEDINLAIGQRQIAVITPSRIIVLAPAPIPNSMPENEVRSIKELLPSEKPLQITAISYTKFEALMTDKTKTKCIPFLGFLIAFAYLGHNVVVFEGHPSAFEGGIKNSDVLIIDSGMLPFLQENWADIAFRVMKPNPRIFVHDRQIYSLVQIARKKSPPGWEYIAPDGEASYANVLLTTLGKMGDRSQTVRITSDQSLPNPKEFTTDPEQLEYISILPFKYEKLNADLVIDIIWKYGQSTNLPVGSESTRTFNGQLAVSASEAIDVSFKLELTKKSDGKQQLEVRLLSAG